MSRAEYMREYRAKRKKGPVIPAGVLIDGLAELQRENAALTDEVARLKRELAARADTTPLTKLATIYDDGRGGQLRKREPGVTPERLDSSFRSFRPAPKSGRK